LLSSYITHVRTIGLVENLNEFSEYLWLKMKQPFGRIIIQIVILTTTLVCCGFGTFCQHTIDYTIHGFAKGFKEGTVFYLNDASDPSNEDGTVDSVASISGRFTFKGSLSESWRRFRIVTKGYTSRYIWVEGGEIQVYCTRKTKGCLILSDSEIQQLQNDLDSSILVIEDKKTQLLQGLDRKKHTNFDKMSLGYRIDTLDRIKRDTIMQFIRKNRQSLISASVCMDFSLLLRKSNLSDIFLMLDEKVKKSFYGKVLYNNYIVTDGRIQVGDTISDFAFSDTNGNTIRLSDMKFEYLLIEFWASGCGPCRIENPKLIKVYDAFKNYGFDVVAVSLDRKKESWLKAIEKDELTWTNTCDFKSWRGNLVKKFGVQAMPMSFLIDSTYTVIEKDIRSEKLEKKLSQLFKLN
jgi:peroxiredoxin